MQAVASEKERVVASVCGCFASGFVFFVRWVSVNDIERYSLLLSAGACV